MVSPCVFEWTLTFAKDPTKLILYLSIDNLDTKMVDRFDTPATVFSSTWGIKPYNWYCELCGDPTILHEIISPDSFDTIEEAQNDADMHNKINHSQVKHKM